MIARDGIDHDQREDDGQRQAADLDDLQHVEEIGREIPVAHAVEKRNEQEDGEGQRRQRQKSVQHFHQRVIGDPTSEAHRQPARLRQRQRLTQLGSQTAIEPKFVLPGYALA